MSLQVEKLGGNMAKMTIELPAEEVEKALQEAYIKERKSISLPGFRKGKVPRQMIEKMFGPEIFYEEAVNQMIGEAYPKAYDESELEIVSQPQIDVVQMEKGKSFVFTAEVAVKPEVTLGEYKGLSISVTEVDVTDEDVEAEISKERERSSRIISVTDRRVQDGDIVDLNYEGFIDEVPFEGGKGENHSLTIGSNSFIAGFEEQLIGTEVGKDIEVKVTFPEQYHAENLAGKDAVFKCTINEIRVKELPELDDEFAADVSEFETLQEYQEDVRKNLLSQREKEAQTQKENQVVELAIENATMDIPEPMLDVETRQMFNDHAQRMQQQGLSMEQYYQFTGMTEEKMLEELRPMAENRIKTRLVLEEIAKAEEIEISEERLEEELQKMADDYQMEIHKIKEFMGEEEKARLKEDIAVQEAITLLVECAVEQPVED